MNEQRATSRRRVFKAGTIEFDGAAVDCIIRNLSTSGAALEVARPVGIPHEITLNILTCNECVSIVILSGVRKNESVWYSVETWGPL
jgi:hypothetical protein